MATPYLQGYLVKPLSVDNVGLVKFTDGTNIIVPNQKQCEAYGYAYDKASGTCSAFTFSTQLGTNFRNENNNTQGSRNTVETGTNNTLIMGESNTVKGLSRNNIIIGSNNEIISGVNNASVFGNYGIAERDGEVVIGGGGFSGAGRGYAQSSIITLTGTTTDATSTSLFVNGDSSTTIIARSSTSSFQGFEANVLGVRTGGSAVGNVNDRIFLRVVGIVYLKADDQSVEILAEYGSTRFWTAGVAFSGTNDMFFKVTGVADMDISWSATLNLYEMIV
tara:strand:- start:2246 stop:3076 length:831 start_codon:yes stop_codon:yes gene_type:complete